MVNKFHNLFNIVVFDEVTSTNDVALEFAESGAPSGTVIVAGRQTRGKGSNGRKWYSPEGGLYFSIILREIEWGSLEEHIYNTVTAFFKKRYGINIKFIEPNDLYIEERKVGGILIDTAFEGNKLQYAVAGIGINLRIKNYPSELKKNAISMIEIKHYSYPSIFIATAILKMIVKEEATPHNL